ncbi:MAG: hypothetical protein ABS951_06655 [Solibacillus sp.]
MNDGLLEYGALKTERNAARKVTGSSFEKVGTLFYEQLSVRESDHLQYGASGKRIDIKVKTLLPPNFSEVDELLIRIGSKFYHVIQSDPARPYVFLYLHLIEGDLNDSKIEAAD